MQCLAHNDGEMATSRACTAAGIVMGLSSFATTTLEDVAKAGGGAEGSPRVLQLYLFEEREHSRKLIRRAKAAGYKAVFLTVDTPMLGRRNLEIRNQFKLPKHLKIANFDEDSRSDAAQTVMEGSAAGQDDVKSDSTEANGTQKKEQESTKVGSRQPPQGPITFHSHAPNPTLNWEKDIQWLKQECGSEMEVWVKGIATAEDALLAKHHGCDGIVVSNHGGRQLDGALATLVCLAASTHECMTSADFSLGRASGSC
jgi:(S)-2-hydroxy-acid oxidase